MDTNKIWHDCLAEISKTVRGESFKTWFEPTSIKEINDDKITIFTPKGEIHAQFLEDKYKGLIAESIKSVLGADFTISIETIKKPIESSDLNRGRISRAMNKEFTFENFIVGQNNEFAYSAALAVAETTGITKFNPLFIYGKSGLGKTHLLQAIGNFILKREPSSNIIYTTSAQFMDEYIKYIEIKKIDDFNRIYKFSDVLLVDDVQFLSGKQGTQEIFFHIFNELFHNNKKIVLTSDKFPKELDGLEDRLVSRFQSGLTVDIQPPNFETKIAILHKKAEKNKLNLPDDVIEYIAKNSSNNIREIEGYLIKILAYSSMYNQDVDLAKAMEILDLSTDSTAKIIYVEQVIDKVASYFNVTKDKIIKGNREKEIVMPRQVAMFLARKLTKSSLKNIGKIFMKDHSTIVHGCHNIEKMMEKDSKLKSDIFNISKNISEQ